jgi:hypothetical protein
MYNCDISSPCIFAEMNTSTFKNRKVKKKKRKKIRKEKQKICDVFYKE